MTVTKQDLQFIYDKNLANYLIRDCKINFLVFGVHHKTKCPFWVFASSEQVNSLIKEFKDIKDYTK